MQQLIRIEDNGSPVGSIVFGNPDQLNVERTANGFKLWLPVTISLNLVRRGDPVPMVSGLRGTVFAPLSPGDRKIEIGRLICDQSFTGGYTDKQLPMDPYDIPTQMIWLGSFAELGFYERLRDVGDVRFDIDLRGELCYLFLPPQPSRHLLRSQPLPIRSNTIYTRVDYSKEAWVGMLRTLGVAENVLVEIPLPGAAPPEWQGVFDALVEARKAFELGAWKACVAAIRLGLEKWREIEPEDLSEPNKRSRTKRQRLDHFRLELHQLANFGVHTGSEACTRADAQVAYTTFSALLAQKHQ